MGCKWVCNSQQVLIDVSGRFAKEVYLGMEEQFNAEIFSTAAEIPWQNGICKRNHTNTDTCLEKLPRMILKTELRVTLARAVNVKSTIRNTKASRHIS